MALIVRSVFLSCLLVACSDPAGPGGADPDAGPTGDGSRPAADASSSTDAAQPPPPPVPPPPPFRCDGVDGVAAELAALAPEQWYEFPSSQLVDSPVAYETDRGTNRSVAGTMNAWSGGAFDSRRSRLLSHGGGHWWYAGNEVYAFSLRTGEWEIAVERSADEDILKCEPIQGDGRPSSTHTYNRITYHAGWDAFVRMTGGAWCENSHGGDYHWIAGLGPDSAAPDHDWNAYYYGDNDVEPDAAHEALALYDPDRDKLYMRGHGWFEVDYEMPCSKSATDWLADPTDTCGVTFREILWESRYTSRNAIIVRGRYVVEIGSRSAVPEQASGVGNEVWIFDLDAGWTKTTANTNGGGADGPDATQNPGLVYDPTNDEIIAWTGGPTVYAMDPDTLLGGTGEWVPRSYDGPLTVPQSEASGGIYNRMQYVPEFRGFVVAPGERQSVYFYKLSTGAECAAD